MMMKERERERDQLNVRRAMMDGTERRTCNQATNTRVTDPPQQVTPLETGTSTEMQKSCGATTMDDAQTMTMMEEEGG